MPKSTCAFRPSRMPTNSLPKILNLKSRTEGVSVKVTGELNRPPYEKGNAGAALYEHARTLAAEIGFDLVDTLTGGGSDGNFTAPHHRDARRPRRRRQGRAYPLRADVHFVDRAAGAAAASAVPDAAMSIARAIPTIATPRPMTRPRPCAGLVLRPAQGPQAARRIRPT